MNVSSLPKTTVLIIKMSTNLVKVGREIGGNLLGNSIPHFVVFYFVVFYIVQFIQFETNCASWRSSWFGPAFASLLALLQNIEIVVLALLYAYLFDRTKSASVLGHLSLIAGFLALTFGISTVIQLLKFNTPHGPTNLNAWDSTVQFLQDRTYNSYAGPGPQALLFALVLGYLAM